MRIPALCLVTALCVSPAAASGATQHLLERELPVPGGLSIAFVGDGFDLDGLTAYRIAVMSFRRLLLEQDVFDLHQDRFNFYRIDVVDHTGETKTLCAADPLAKITVLELDGEAGPSVAGYEEEDLGVVQCWAGNNSDVLYTSQEELAISLAAGVPDLKVVVVVANARLPSGGARLLVNEQDITLVVVGSHVSPIEQGSSVYAIDEHAIAILVHELGHALGLLDEYESTTMLDTPDFQVCRNVWKPDLQPQWPATPTWPASVDPIPWQGVLPYCCSPQSMVRCQAHDPDGPCVLQDIEVAEAYCSYVPRSGNPTASCLPLPECDAFPGAWEGAFYSMTDYYRASATCRMYSTGVKQQFCKACRQYLDIYLEHFGANAGTGTWPKARCESPGCASTPPIPQPGTPPQTPTEVWRSDEPAVFHN